MNTIYFCSMKAYCEYSLKAPHEEATPNEYQTYVLLHENICCGYSLKVPH